MNSNAIELSLAQAAISAIVRTASTSSITLD